MKKLLLLLICVFFILPVSAEPRIISITGESEFEVDADIINISFSIENQDETSSSKANEKVSVVAQTVIGKLVGLGISEEDIRSPSFNYEWDRDYDADCPGEHFPYVGRGMTLKLTDIDKYTDVIDILLNSGVTSIDEIDSEISSFDEQNNEAMKLAILDAKEKAKFYVESFDGKLGGIYRIGKNQSNYNRWGGDAEEIVVHGTRSSRAHEKPYKFRPAPVTIEASIYVEFEIK